MDILYSMCFWINSYLGATKLFFLEKPEKKSFPNKKDSKQGAVFITGLAPYWWNDIDNDCCSC